MLLYYCEKCGRWRDVSLLQKLSTFVDNLSKVINQPVDTPEGYPCPGGHGFMLQVALTDRIQIRATIIEQPKESEASNE